MEKERGLCHCDSPVRDGAQCRSCNRWWSLEAMEQELTRLREEKELWLNWRADVTVALGRPGGAFYAEVPGHIRQLREDLAKVTAERDKWKTAYESLRSDIDIG